MIPSRVGTFRYSLLCFSAIGCSVSFIKRFLHISDLVALMNQFRSCSVEKYHGKIIVARCQFCPRIQILFNLEQTRVQPVTLAVNVKRISHYLLLCGAVFESGMRIMKHMFSNCIKAWQAVPMVVVATWDGGRRVSASSTFCCVGVRGSSWGNGIADAAT